MQIAGWKRYYIILDRPLSKGKKAKFAFDQELFDSAKTFEPFLAKHVDQPVGQLIIRVHFSQALAPATNVVTCTRPADPGSKNILEESEMKLDANGRYAELVMVKPRLGYRYSIEWRWTDYATYVAPSTS